ncbi:hypothetical protein AA15669_1473 [Saccharibacter floricola DSM 15669]|uniref:Uncharacterized protein n=1 Tax=Saccharibacter floricola DSM 15669 TaxID=1123227 RepID=A0ABQ0NZU4_9PROT|nr:hypothetical protein AA15669_1473 [Saccharibacter floricola DSM 15669]
MSVVCRAAWVACRGCTDANNHSTKLGERQASCSGVTHETSGREACQTDIGNTSLPCDPEDEVNDELDGNKQDKTTDPHFAESKKNGM